MHFRQSIETWATGHSSDESFEGFNGDVRGFKVICDYLFYMGSRITIEPLIETILEEIIDFFDIIGFLQDDSGVTFVRISFPLDTIQSRNKYFRQH